jgi:hypothetical protein
LSRFFKVPLALWFPPKSALVIFSISVVNVDVVGATFDVGDAFFGRIGVAGAALTWEQVKEGSAVGPHQQAIAEEATNRMHPVDRRSAIVLNRHPQKIHPW